MIRLIREFVTNTLLKKILDIEMISIIPIQTALVVCSALMTKTVANASYYENDKKNYQMSVAISIAFICRGIFRGGSRTAATSKMEHFVIIVNGWKPLTIITKSSILDVATVLDPPLTFE